MWIRKLGANELVALAQVLSGGCHQAVGQDCSPNSTGAEGFTPMLNSQVVGGPRFPVGYWTEVPSSWPHHLVFSIEKEWQLASPVPVFREIEREATVFM